MLGVAGPKARVRWPIAPWLTGSIRRVHMAHRGRWRRPTIHAALRAGGYMASRGRVERIMRHHGIRAITLQRFFVYPVHVRTRKSFGLMTRKLSVTEFG